MTRQNILENTINFSEAQYKIGNDTPKRAFTLRNLNILIK